MRLAKLATRAVVGHDEGGALVFGQRVAQGDDRLEIQVVGRLVEHEHVVLRQHQLGEDHAHGFAADNASVGFMPSSPLNSILPSRPRMSCCVASVSKECSQALTVVPLGIPSR